jgi:hypothetical protein
MTGFDSKRQAAQDKMNDEADTLTIVYQRGFADGKMSAQRKPLTDAEMADIWDDALTSTGPPFFIRIIRAVERAHNIKEQP